jgi:Sulfotransferase domain
MNMRLRVIGAGYPRTGTVSLKLALEQLELGPCHHMREIMMNPASAGLWVQAADGKPDWEVIFKEYQSCTDVPGCTFWRELADYYPEAKVLLSVRDPEKWFESTQATVFSPAWRQRSATTPLKEFFEKAVYADFGERINDHNFMLEQFNRHNGDVVRGVPKERLLVFDVREGWESLCKFLNVPVPNTPFPNANSCEEMAAMRAASGAKEPTEPMDLDEMQKFARERFGRK